MEDWTVQPFNFKEVRKNVGLHSMPQKLYIK